MWTNPAGLILIRNVTRQGFPHTHPEAPGEQIEPVTSLWGCTRRFLLLCGPSYACHDVLHRAESVRLIQHLCSLSFTQIKTSNDSAGEMYPVCPGSPLWPVYMWQTAGLNYHAKTECKRIWWQGGFVVCPWQSLCGCSTKDAPPLHPMPIAQSPHRLYPHHTGLMQPREGGRQGLCAQAFQNVA